MNDKIFFILIILMTIFFIVIFVAKSNKQISSKKNSKNKTHNHNKTTSNRYKIIGAYGENKIKEKLATLSQDYIVYNNVYLKVNDRSCQIDHVVVSKYGIFVIETKNHSGNIYGSDDNEYWTKYINENKYQFHNPLKQNYYHLKSLQEILAFPKNLFIPIIVFTEKANLKCDTKNLVIYENQLKSSIYSFKTPIIAPQTVNYAINRLNAFLILDKDREKRHSASINQYLKEKNELINQGICPKCKSKLVEKDGKYGKFLGCSNYPLCKFTTEL